LKRQLLAAGRQLSESEAKLFAISSVAILKVPTRHFGEVYIQAGIRELQGNRRIRAIDNRSVAEALLLFLLCVKDRQSIRISVLG
jgi:hypothetical protein